MRFSASKLSTWMMCPRMAKFHYVDHLPGRQNAKASFGVVIHHALELYNQNGDLEEAIEDFKLNWKNPSLLEVEPDYWPRRTDYSGLRTRGLEILREYHDKQRWETREIIATEHRFLVPIGQHTFTGVIDLVEMKKSGKGKDMLRVVDYKGSTRKPTMSELFLNIQFTIYVYATTCREFWVGNREGDEVFEGIENGQWLFETFAKTPRRPIWYHLWTNSELDAGQRGDEDYQRMYALLNEVEKAMERDVFVPTISGDSCGICDYVEPCGLVIPTPEQVAEQENAWL